MLFAARKLPICRANRPGDMYPDTEFLQQINRTLNLTAEFGK